MTVVPHVRVHDQRKRRSLHDAKASFIEAIRRGIDDLMTTQQYSRERATSALLRELRRTADDTERRKGVMDVSPTDDEIFHLMTIHGIGISAAEQCLIVSKSVRKLMSEKGLSAVEAIDDLTVRLSVVNLVASSLNSGKESAAEKLIDSKGIAAKVIVPNVGGGAPMAAAGLPNPVSRKLPSSARKTKTNKCGKNRSEKITAVRLNGKNHRKRSLCGHDEEKQPSPSRARADSMTEVENAKREATAVATKEVMPSTRQNSTGRNKRPGMLSEMPLSQSKRQRSASDR